MTDKTNQYAGQLENVSVVYNIYRIVLPLVLLVTFVTNPDTTILGMLNPNLFLQVSIVYAVLGLITLVISNQNPLARSIRRQIVVFIIDIITISVITYSSGGISSGLGLLLVVTIASASILMRGRISIFLAAIATLSVFYCEFYLSILLVDSSSQFLQVGILGTVLFATAYYLQTATNRIYRAAVLAEKQADDIIELEKLNHEVIQRMRTGIAVVNSDNKLVTLNGSARELLQVIHGDHELSVEASSVLPHALIELLETWKEFPLRQPRSFSLPHSRQQIQANFAFLHPDSGSDVLMFLEDNRQIVKRVRQAKLASLGRLTASIAHEIRNPLGAISHATQLLKESENIDQSDRRMVEIVLDHCARVNQIVEDILDVSRHNDSSSSKIELKSWLESFIKNYRDTHEACDEIELLVDPENTRINVISSQLEQVLNNLFDNGLRYSKIGCGQARLKVSAGAEISDTDYQPYLHVIDEGPGIDDEAEARLFEPFYTTESSGTGLGLYISKELCEANQAQLVYSKNEAGKSCFSIYFSHPDRSVS